MSWSDLYGREQHVIPAALFPLPHHGAIELNCKDIIRLPMSQPVATGFAAQPLARRLNGGWVFVFLAVLLGACGGTAGSAAARATATLDCGPFPQGSGPYTYVAIGASDAVGFGATCPERDGYVPQLGLRMPHGTKVVDLGIGGATARIALLDELPDAIAAHPNIATVWLAANDFRAMEDGALTLDQYTQQLDQALTELQTQTQAHVYVGNLPDLTQLPIFQHGQVPLTVVAHDNATWNAAIAGLVARHHMVLVDLSHSDLASHPAYIFSDGFHPTTLGYLQLANMFWNVMRTNGDPHA